MRDVLIIGGGIAGVSLADHLARAGVDVVLLERGELNREASGTNAGSMHLQIAIHQFIKGMDDPGEAERLQEETRLAAEAAELWKALDAELGLDFHVTGGLMVAESEEQLQLLRDKQPLEAAAGLETHVLEGAEVRAFAPYLSERVIGATYCPAEGHVNPLIAVERLARRSGAEIVTGVEVTAIEPGFRVHTSAGIYEAERVVNAAGAWAPTFQTLPMRAMGLHVNVTEPRARLLEPMIQHIGRRLTLKQAHNGTFIIGGGWPSREAPGRWATTWESAAGQRRGRGRRRSRAARRPAPAHLVGRDRLDRRRLPAPRRVRGARALHDRRRLVGLHAQPTVRAHARRPDRQRHRASP